MNEPSMPERWCPACGYDLRGTPASGEDVPQVCCPECGWRGAPEDAITPALLERRRDCRNALLALAFLITPVLLLFILIAQADYLYTAGEDDGPGYVYALATPVLFLLYALISRQVRRSSKMPRNRWPMVIAVALFGVFAVELYFLASLCLVIPMSVVLLAVPAADATRYWGQDRGFRAKIRG
ncbi:MAG: hypothetical protein AAGA57_03565 [Planctomycetota bacterium]